MPRLGWRWPRIRRRRSPNGSLPLLEAIARTGSLAARGRAVRHLVSHGMDAAARRRAAARRAARAARARTRGDARRAAGRRLLDAPSPPSAASRVFRRRSPSSSEPSPRGDRGPRGSAPCMSPRATTLRLPRCATRPPRGGLDLDLRFVGSLTALEDFAQGRADAAGFHVATGARGRDDRAPFLRFLSARRDRLVRFVDREQGLILPRGNPARVRSLRDVAARGLRFVNRQRGSGTRLLLDRRLAGEGIAADALARLRERGIHARRGRGDGRLGRGRRRLRLAGRGGRVRARVRAAGARALLPRGARRRPRTSQRSSGSSICLRGPASRSSGVSPVSRERDRHRGHASTRSPVPCRGSAGS